MHPKEIIKMNMIKYIMIRTKRNMLRTLKYIQNVYLFIKPISRVKKDSPIRLN